MIVRSVCSSDSFSRDTSGQERFRTITTSYYRGAMGIMLIYSITSQKTFDSIPAWMRNIEEVRVHQEVRVFLFLLAL